MWCRIKIIRRERNCSFDPFKTRSRSLYLFHTHVHTHTPLTSVSQTTDPTKFTSMFCLCVILKRGVYCLTLWVPHIRSVITASITFIDFRNEQKAYHNKCNFNKIQANKVEGGIYFVLFWKSLEFLCDRSFHDYRKQTTEVHTCWLNTLLRHLCMFRVHSGRGKKIFSFATDGEGYN